MVSMLSLISNIIDEVEYEKENVKKLIICVEVSKNISAEEIGFISELEELINKYNKNFQINPIV